MQLFLTSNGHFMMQQMLEAKNRIDRVESKSLIKISLNHILA